MPKISVPWSDKELPMELPDNWSVQQIAHSQLSPGKEDWTDRLASALNKPDTALPLEKLLAARPNGRIVLVIEDITRHSPVPKILEVVMREIRHAKIDDAQVEVVFANGMHPPMTDAEAAEKLGSEVDNLKWRNNPWHDKSQYVSVGSAGKIDYLVDRQVAEADLRIVISAVCPHLQAGFGGGFKMIFPGCSHLDTIRPLHRLGLGRRAKQMVGTDAEKNAMRAAIDAGGKLLDAYGGSTFAVHYMLDDDNRPVHIGAGDPISTQRMLAKQSSIACGIITPAPLADVLITNAFPRDFDLWQSFKAVANTRWAARPGGVIICLSRCVAGLNGMDPPKWPLGAAWTRRIVRWLGPEALCSLLMRLVPSLAGDAGFFVRMGLQTIHRNPIFMVADPLHATGANFPGLDVFATPEEAFAAAEKLLGDGPQKVTVFPSGGTTFPVPTTGPIGR
jgi:nickel-dependent lactate racemase